MEWKNLDKFSGFPPPPQLFTFFNLSVASKVLLSKIEFSALKIQLESRRFIMYLSCIFANKTAALVKSVIKTRKREGNNKCFH